jgi:hypothetical protein
MEEAWCTATLFGSKESEWMETIEDGKFIGKRVSTVWLLH